MNDRPKDVKADPTPTPIVVDERNMIARPSRGTRARGAASIVAGMLVAFAIGYGWQYLRASRLQDQLEEAQRELEIQRVVATLGVATAEALRGAYEPARQLASEAYTRLQGVREAADETQRLAIDAILAERDATITGLSRSDPQTTAILGNTLMRLRGALGEGGGAASIPAPTAPAPSTP